MAVSVVDLIREKEVNAQLRAENAALRKEMVEKDRRDKARCKSCEYHPHPELERA